MTITTKQDRQNGRRLTSQGVCPLVRWRLSLLLLLLMAVGVQRTWAVDDEFRVTNTTGAELLYKGNTLIPTGGTYTTLTLGLAADEGTDVFKIENGGNCITYAGAGYNPTFTDSKPTGGHVYVFTTTKPGEFVFEVKLNGNKTIHFRNTLGTDLNVRKNTSGESIDNYKWAVTVETAGTYYLYADGSKLPFYGYTFTRKVPKGITSIPYQTDFSSDVEPFDDGNIVSVASTNNVLTLNSVAPNSGVAVAGFKKPYTLKSTEQVTLSFTAYHGYLNKDRFSRVTLYNSDDCPLISYTYSKSSKKITDISFNEVVADGFLDFDAQSHCLGENGANGFAGNGRPFTNTAGDNPVITMTVSGNGTVSFNLTRGWRSVNKTFSDQLAGVKMDLAYIKVEDTSDNADRGIGIDNLKITSQLASLDYETGLVDWTTNTSERYTPVIATDGSNHYLSVNQAERADGKGGATLTSTTLNGRVGAGQDFTLSFDMKIGNNNRSGSSGPPTLTVFAANNSDYIFKMYSTAANNTEWKLNDLDNVNLSGTGTFSGENGLVSLEWYHYIISKTGDKVYVTIDSDNGTKHYYRKGIANSSVGGLGNFQFVTGKDHANFAIDNIKVVPYASTAFSQDGKVETYTIMGAGDLPQKDEGNTITIEYGTADEVQMTEQLAGTEYFGSYAIDTNVSGVYTRAWGTDGTVAPILGTFYVIKPKYAGKLSITGWLNELNNVIIRKADGTSKQTLDGSSLTANTLFTHDFTTSLEAGETYYLFAATAGTGDHNGSLAESATLHLTGFTFTQDAMNRQVNVSDLLYEAGKSGEALKRIIPGFELEYSAGVTSSANHQSLAFTNGSKLTVTLRQNGYNATVSSITLVGSDGANIATGYTVDTSVAGKATVTATTNLENVAAFIIGYTADDAQSYKLWLNEDKENIDNFSFANGHVMRVPGDNRTFSQTPTFGAGSSYYVPNFAYKSSNTSVATINTDGSNGQLRKAGSVTITATFAETDYFLSKSATYTVDNVLRANETYNVDVANDKILRIGAYADVASTALSLSGGKTSASSFTYGTTLEKLYTRTTSGGTVTVKNETANNITINTLQVLTPTPVAYLYYEGQEENYSEQLVFQSLPSGPVKGFRVLDIGDPTDPIDLTDTYQMDGNYVWTDGTNVTTTLGGTFSIDDGSFTASSQVIGEGAVLPTVSHALTRKAGAPSDGYSSSLTATANIFIAKPSDTDGDSTYDTYHVWDMTTSVSASGQMDSRWRWDAHGYYQTWMPEYLPVLNNSGKTLAGNEGLLLKGDARYHTGSTGLRLNLTSVNASLKFPVKKGMEVKIVMSSSAADISHIINNVTTTTGDATNTLYIEKEGINVTAYYLAKEDGAVEIRSMDKQGGYVKSITLQVPRIHFDEEIITMQATGSAYTVINLPNNTGDATLTYTIAGEYTLPTTYNGDGTSVSSGTVATSVATDGKVTITGNEGYAIINVENVSATGVQPRKGSYRLYIIDFKYDPATDILTDLSASNTESTYGGTTSDYPTGYNKVVQPVTYSITFSDGARGQLVQESRTNPRLTTFTLSAYSPGTISLTATTGRISTTRTLTLGGYAFKEVAPVVTLEELKAHNWIYTNDFPDGFTPTSVTVDMSGDAHCTAAAIEDGKIKLTMAETTGGGALRVNATDASSNTIHFVLTIAYPASKGKKWNFYQMNYDDDNNDSTPVVYGLKIGKIDDYDSDKNQVKEGVTITGTNTWTTTGTNWDKIFRKGEEQPRWAYRSAMRGDNGFVVEETAGLQIETGPQGFYIDNPHQPTEFAYNHIGLHNNATVTIPRLKAGDYIALNLSRVLPNNGAILSATNVTDLAGTTVNHTFTITRSQIDYRENGVLAVDGSGARVIPGYYTFRAAADGDVSFTLSDEGYLDILSIEIYDGSYKPTMTDIVTDGTNVAPPATFLMDDGETEEVNLAICHLMRSTSVGPAEYVVVDKVGGLDATLENVEWVSDGGALYNKGKITVNDSYGKLLVRMNNYTADGRYLTGYTPTYSLTVGHKPHQDYPFTWNFENISGGAVKDHNNNAYNSISTDYYTWQNLGYETFILDTRTAAGSLYVPGATLVASSYDLGQKGEISYLNANNYGCDEFNGLGFTGQVSFRTALQAAEEPAAPAALNANSSLLNYAMNSTTNVSAAADYPTGEGVVAEYWTAGDGFIKFGSPSKRDVSAIAAGGAHYLMDGGTTKYLLVKPERALKEGDVITLKGYTPNNVTNVLLSGFSFYAAQLDNAYDDLLTLNWESSNRAVEQTITHTVGQGDGLAGRDSVYIFRAGKQYSVYLTEISITTTDEATPTIAERALTCNGDVTVTIPDLKQDYYVYIKSIAAPKTIPTNLTAAVAADGLDANTDVYKYKVLADGDANVTFADGTKIYRIGVTNILKPLTRVGTGDAWATESRNHAIDYKQTGVFTVNDITANTVTAKTYGLQRITVKMNPQTDAMPAETGMVLKLPLVGADDDATTANVNNFAKAKNYNSTNKTGEVPLFYPPHSTPILSDAVKFGGSQENLMMANLDKRELTYERETGVIDNDGDAVDDSGRADGNYTRFIFASRYMKWTKGETLEHSDFTDGTVPVFYRLHIYEVGEKVDGDVLDSSEAAALNTLGFNKAYMLIHSGNVPEALWKDAAASARPFIGIEGISDMEEYDPALGTGRSQGDGRTYNLRGQMMDDGSSLTPGVYIRNGKKIVIK